MTSPLRKFLVQYSHFFTGNLLSLLLGFVSFPILTRVLSREEYGVMGLLSTTMLLAVAVAKAGLSDGIIRYYKEYEESEERKSVFASTVAIRGLVLAAIVAAAYWLTIPLVTGQLDIKDAYLACFLIMTAYLFVRPLNIIVLNVLRITERTIFYNIFNIVIKALSIALSLVLLLLIVKDFYGYFIGLAAAEAAASVFLFYWFFKNYKVRLGAASGELAKKLIRFGVPLLLTEISYLLLSYADRYMIAAYKGEAELGLYSVGYNLASYAGDIIMFSLSYAVIPIYVGLYQKSGREETEKFLSKCMNYLLIAVVTVFFVYLTVAKDLFVALASEKYEEAAAFSPIILLGSFFIGANNIFNAGLYLKKKSSTILGIMLFALAANIAANLILLPEFGATGAAVATLIACVIATGLTIAFSFKHIRISVKFGTILFYLVLSIAAYAGITRIDTGSEWLNLLVKTAAWALVIIPGVLFREKEIFQKVKGLPLFSRATDTAR